mgnify:CR=1 FL=1
MKYSYYNPTQIEFGERANKVNIKIYLKRAKGIDCL